MQDISKQRPFVLLDVGAAGGIDPRWSGIATEIDFVLVEPSAIAAAELELICADKPRCVIIRSGLAGIDGPRTLFLTRAPACSSLLEPDMEVLERYTVGPLFAVVDSTTIECERYDTLHAAGAPIPDFIKLDTQGTELEILQGFGDLLHHCSGIVLEAHFYRLYKGQSLIGEIVEYLDRFDLCLRDTIPCRSFDDEFVEMDAIFTRRINSKSGHDLRARVELIERLYNLPKSAWGAQLVKDTIGEDAQAAVAPEKPSSFAIAA